MKKKYVNTLVALVALAAMWGAFTYYERRKNPPLPPGTTVETRTVEKLFTLDAKHVQSITLKPKDAAPITCRRESGNWVIAEPQKLAADQSAISTLLTNLTDASVDEVMDAHPAQLKDFGLDPPAESVEVTTDAKPAQFTLLLGDETPTGGDVYAQVGGNPRVVSLASYEKTGLTKTLFDLRDKRAVTLDADRIQQIEVASKDKKYTLVKNPEGVWDLDLPPPVRADRYTAENMVTQLRGLAMASIVAEDKKKTAEYGFATPALTLKVSGPDGSQTLVLGKKDGDKYDAMNSALEPVFTLNADVLTQFQKDPEDLRDKDLFSFSSFEVTHLDVQTPKGHWTFDKQKDKWKETAPASKDLTSDKMESLLDQIHDLRADSFPKEHATDLNSFGLAKPAYRFEVQSGSKKEIVEAAKAADHVYARRSTDQVPSELGKTALDAIEKALGQL